MMDKVNMILIRKLIEKQLLNHKNLIANKNLKIVRKII